MTDIPDQLQFAINLRDTHRCLDQHRLSRCMTNVLCQHEYTPQSIDIMKPTFEWNSALPERPPAKQVEETIHAILEHFNGPRKHDAEVLVVRLCQDELRRYVNGVGLSLAGKPTFKFRYSLTEPWICLWDYYDNPIGRF